MYPNLFGQEWLPMYAIMIIIGVIGFGILFIILAKKLNMNKFDFINFIGILGVAGLVMYGSAFLFDALFHSIEEGKLTTWGITFLGGLIGALIGFIAMYLIMGYSKKSLYFFMNKLILGLVLAHAFGRLGCFFAGCCYGKETTSWLGVTFPIGSDAYYEFGPDNKVLPTQLFESLFLFILFIVLLLIKKHKFIVYLYSYGIFRFILEFFRGDDRGAVFYPFSPSQLLCIIMVIAAIILTIKHPDEGYHGLRE